MKKNLLWLTLVGTMVVLAGCSTSPRKPAVVVDKSTYAQPSEAQQTLIDAEQKRLAALASGQSYTVRQGDTLYSIAMRHGLSVNELKTINNISDPTQIKPGQVLALSRNVRTPYEADTPSDVRVTPIAVPHPSTHASALPTQSSTVHSAAPSTTTDSASSARSSSVSTQPETQNVSAKAQSSAQTTLGPVSGSRMIWPIKGKVLADYKKTGKGLDIAGTKGDVVVAAMDGDVLFVGVVKGYGNLVIVKHSPTLVTAYGNNDRVTVTNGTHVKAGQKIAELGLADGTPALRFEVREKGKPVDPMQYLP